ncbi:MAG: thioredoxin family protein [Bacteroidia bacterium]
MNKSRIFAFLTLLFLSFSALSAQHFVSDFADAQAKAKSSDKPLVILFSGSDWCRPCIQLHNLVYKNESFQEYANENLVIYLADFPRRPENQLPADVKATNDQLAQQYGLRGVPTTLVLSSEGEVLGKMVGNPDGTYDGYVNKLKGFVSQ